MLQDTMTSVKPDICIGMLRRRLASSPSVGARWGLRIPLAQRPYVRKFECLHLLLACTGMDHWEQSELSNYSEVQQYCLHEEPFSGCNMQGATMQPWELQRHSAQAEIHQSVFYLLAPNREPRPDTASAAVPSQVPSVGAAIAWPLNLFEPTLRDTSTATGAPAAMTVRTAVSRALSVEFVSPTSDATHSLVLFTCTQRTPHATHLCRAHCKKHPQQLHAWAAEKSNYDGAPGR